MLLTEEEKAENIGDCLRSFQHYPISDLDYNIERAKRIIRLVRALDNQRERDNKGRFIKKN